MAEKIAAQDHREHPADAADHVVDDEAFVSHGADAGNDRRKGSDDRHETGDDDGERTVAFVELLGRQQMFAIEEPGVGTTEESRAGARADIVTECIAENGGEA